MDFAPGYKTYILIAVGAALNIAVAAGWLNVEQLGLINQLLTFAGLGTIHQAVVR